MTEDEAAAAAEGAATGEATGDVAGGSWWDIARDPEQPTARRVAHGLGCGLLPWLCISQHAAAESRRAGAELHAAGERVVGEAGGLLERGAAAAGTVAREAGEAAGRPLEAAAEVAMWASVGLGILLLGAILALVVWYVLLPVLDGGPS